MSVPIGTKAKSDSQYEMRGNKSSKKKKVKKKRESHIYFRSQHFVFNKNKPKKKTKWFYCII